MTQHPDLLGSLATIAGIAARTLGLLLFGTALLAKLRHFGEFAAIVARYLGASIPVARTAAAIVIGLEIAVVTLLLIPAMAVPAGILGCGLLVAFGGAMAAAIRRGEKDLDCGCHQSALRQRVRPALVVRNLLLAILLLPLFAAPSSGAIDPFALLNGAAAGLLLYILNVAFGTFVALDDSFAELKRRYG